jgi:hypothetical protein
MERESLEGSVSTVSTTCVRNLSNKFSPSVYPKNEHLVFQTSESFYMSSKILVYFKAFEDVTIDLKVISSFENQYTVEVSLNYFIADLLLASLRITERTSRKSSTWCQKSMERW